MAENQKQYLSLKLTELDEQHMKVEVECFFKHTTFEKLIGLIDDMVKPKGYYYLKALGKEEDVSKK